MERSPEPLVQEFLRDDQQEFHFSDEEEETMALEKNSKQEKSRSRVRNGEVIE
jgi:hypothetical protein